MDDEIVVFCTVPQLDLGKKIARAIIQEKLAACCNIIPGLTSIYYWQDQIHEDQEYLLMIKTLKSEFDRLNARIREMHTYQVPEVIAVRIAEGNWDYLNWIHEVVEVNGR